MSILGSLSAASTDRALWPMRPEDGVMNYFSLRRSLRSVPFNLQQRKASGTRRGLPAPGSNVLRLTSWRPSESYADRRKITLTLRYRSLPT